MAGGWHLDKKVPISVIVTLLIQTAAFVWWAATVEQRVKVLEDAVKNSEDRVDSLINRESNASSTIAVIQQQVHTITINQDRSSAKIEELQRSTSRIEAKLDLLIEQN